MSCCARDDSKWLSGRCCKPETRGHKARGYGHNVGFECLVALAMTAQVAQWTPLANLKHAGIKPAATGIM
jgi:hypothetical protein